CRSTALDVTRTTSTGACAAADTIAAVSSNAIETARTLFEWVIVSTRGIVGIERWRHGAHSRLHQTVDRRKNDERGECGHEQAADDGTSQRHHLSPLAGTRRQGNHAGDHRG